MNNIDPSRIRADYSDQLGIFNPDSFAETLTVIGCGGIGASVLPTLVTMGFKRYILWDDDTVEARNLASQLLFRAADLYRPKVEAARDYLLAYGATHVEIKKQRFTADDEPEGVVISGVDSMEARQVIWQSIKSSTTALYLDGRIGGEHMTLLTVEPFDAEWYEKRWLFPSSKAAPLPCTTRAIVYPAVALGAWMASHIAMWSRGDIPPRRLDQNLGSHFFQVTGVQKNS